MKRYPDNYFDLAIVDPPYGINESGQTNKTRGKLAKSKDYGSKNWDNKSPNIEYFNELIRVSKNQIIWGANHFISKTPYDSSCWIVWDKDNGETDFADSELAYTSFKTAVRNYKFKWHGMIQHDMKNKEVRIHPTQKPVKLYEWLLMNYAKEGDKILDTHLGSGSIAIACHNLGFELTACELDTEYYKNALKRLQQHQAQLTMF
jgi:site-specific DNA-methyltransferase (adenine-specific)